MFIGRIVTFSENMTSAAFKMTKIQTSTLNYKCYVPVPYFI